jgi:hypothetical protein
MWAKVKVVTRDEFLRMSAGNRRVACVD